MHFVPRMVKSCCRIGKWSEFRIQQTCWGPRRGLMENHGASACSSHVSCLLSLREKRLLAKWGLSDKEKSQDSAWSICTWRMRFYFLGVRFSVPDRIRPVDSCLAFYEKDIGILQNLELIQESIFGREHESKKKKKSSSWDNTLVGVVDGVILSEISCCRKKALRSTRSELFKRNYSLVLSKLQRCLVLFDSGLFVTVFRRRRKCNKESVLCVPLPLMWNYAECCFLFPLNSKHSTSCCPAALNWEAEPGSLRNNDWVGDKWRRIGNGRVGVTGYLCSLTKFRLMKIHVSSRLNTGFHCRRPDTLGPVCCSALNLAGCVLFVSWLVSCFPQLLSG